MIGVNALIGSLDMLLEFGVHNIEKRVLDNTKHLIERLHSLGIKPVCSKYANKNLSGIVSFSSPQSKMMNQRLTEEKISTSLREGFVRMSHHFYNTFDELDTAVEVIKSCIP
ncbi:hypothetical protein MASR1M107_10090 [Ignavibacteriales bacterium]